MNWTHPGESSLKIKTRLEPAEPDQLLTSMKNSSHHSHHMTFISTLFSGLCGENNFAPSSYVIELITEEKLKLKQKHSRTYTE